VANCFLKIVKFKFVCDLRKVAGVVFARSSASSKSFCFSDSLRRNQLPRWMLLSATLFRSKRKDVGARVLSNEPKLMMVAPSSTTSADRRLLFLREHRTPLQACCPSRASRTCFFQLLSLVEMTGAPRRAEFSFSADCRDRTKRMGRTPRSKAICVSNAQHLRQQHSGECKREA